MRPSPSPNFAYLAHHDARLVALATQAEQHFAADPTITLFKLRQFGEVLAQRAAAKVGLYVAPQENQQGGTAGEPLRVLLEEVLSWVRTLPLDYRALSNAGLWCIGRLQTDADRARVLDGLAAARGTEGYGDELGTTPQRLAPRWFVVRKRTPRRRRS